MHERDNARTRPVTAFTKSVVSLMVLLFGLLAIGISGSMAANDWKDVSSSPCPSPRYWAAMAMIDKNNVLLYGGYDGAMTIYRDTWVFNVKNKTWTQKAGNNAPTERVRAAMAYAGAGKVVLYGGSPLYTGPRGTAPQALETWVYDLATDTWTKMSPKGAPPALDGHSMCFIGSGDKVLMFGGRVIKQQKQSDQTWIYDLSQNKWAQKNNKTTRPGARASFGMAYLGGDQAVLFGGYNGTSQTDETWLYDEGDTKWTKINPTAKPPARYNLTAAYLGGDQMVIFGGRADVTTGSSSNSTSILYNDTWVLDLSDNTWTEDTNSKTPDPRGNARLAETSLDGSSKLVLFGGNSDTEYFDDTWLFGGGDYLSKEVPGEQPKEAAAAVPLAFELKQNYPNPFNPSTEIVFSIPKGEMVVVKVYSILGEEVRTLVNDFKTAGQYSVSWDGKDSAGHKVSSGVYLYRLQTNSHMEVKKMTFLQ